MEDHKDGGKVLIPECELRALERDAARWRTAEHLITLYLQKTAHFDRLKILEILQNIDREIEKGQGK